MASSEPPTRFLIRNGRVYHHDGDVDCPPINDILIDGETIKSIGPTIAVSEDVEVINARGKLIIPGLVNAHYHSHDAFAKGLFEQIPFDIWNLYAAPINYGKRTLEEVRLRTLIGAAEALLNGITTIQDMLTVVPQDDEYVDTVLAAYQEIGVRVVFSLSVRDRAALDIAQFIAGDVPDTARRKIVGEHGLPSREIDFVSVQLKRSQELPADRLTWALGPSGPQRCSRELLEGIASLSKTHDLPVLTHVYETKIQAAAARELYPQQNGSLLEVLADAGLMNERLGVVHGVWLSPKEIAQIAEAGARVIHNPISNLKLKSGIAPILELHRAGIDIALGCDNTSCGDTQNIFQAMRMLCLLPAVADPRPGPITAAYAMRAATTSGARVLGLGGKVGALKPGMMADLVILDLAELSFVPFNSAARQLVFAENGRAVETVFVAGRPVVRNGKLVHINEVDLAGAVAECLPAFRRDLDALIKQNENLLDSLWKANRAAWDMQFDFDRNLKQ